MGPHGPHCARREYSPGQHPLSARGRLQSPCRPATTRSVVALASPARTISTSISTVKPCASMIASVQPSRQEASNSSARRRVAGGLRRGLPTEGHCRCLRDGDVQVEPTEIATGIATGRLSTCRRPYARQPWPSVRRPGHRKCTGGLPADTLQTRARPEPSKSLGERGELHGFCFSDFTFPARPVQAALTCARLRKSANTAAISPSLGAQSSGGTRSTSRSPGKRSCSSLPAIMRCAASAMA